MFFFFSSFAILSAVDVLRFILFSRSHFFLPSQSTILIVYMLEMSFGFVSLGIFINLMVKYIAEPVISGHLFKFGLGLLATS